MNIKWENLKKHKSNSDKLEKIRLIIRDRYIDRQREQESEREKKLLCGTGREGKKKIFERETNNIENRNKTDNDKNLINQSIPKYHVRNIRNTEMTF